MIEDDKVLCGAHNPMTIKFEGRTIFTTNEREELVDEYLSRQVSQVTDISVERGRFDGWSPEWVTKQLDAENWKNR